MAKGKKDSRVYRSYRDKISEEKLKELKKKAKREDKPIVVKKIKDVTEPQSGAKHSKARDKKRRALPPGLRISKEGNVYYAYRRDHSDRKD